MEIQALLEKPDSFKQWLEGKKLGAVVGERSNHQICPLARFLSQVGDLADVSVDRDVSFRMQEYGEQQILDLPDWAQRFRDLVDEDSPHVGVTARTALRLLQTVSTTAL